MTRLDHNSNGKIDPDELARLNQRMASGGRRGPASSSTTPTLRKPPEKPAAPAETATPPATPKPEEKKPEAPAFETKAPDNFGK